MQLVNADAVPLVPVQRPLGEKHKLQLPQSTSPCRVRLLRQVEHQFGKLRRLADEQSVADEAVDSAHSVDLAGRSRPNYRAMG